MGKININRNGVYKLLKNLNQHKATGPDNIPALILEEAAYEMAPILSHLYQTPLTTVKYQTTGKKQQ